MERPASLPLVAEIRSLRSVPPVPLVQAQVPALRQRKGVHVTKVDCAFYSFLLGFACGALFIGLSLP